MRNFLENKGLKFNNYIVSSSNAQYSEFSLLKLRLGSLFGKCGEVTGISTDSENSPIKVGKHVLEIMGVEATPLLDTNPAKPHISRVFLTDVISALE